MKRTQNGRQAGMIRLILSIIFALAMVLSTTGGMVFANNEGDDSGASRTNSWSEDRGSDDDSDDEGDDSGASRANSRSEDRGSDDDSDDEVNSNVTRSTTFYGIVTSLTSRRLTIDGNIIRLDRKTTIQGVLVIGATVEVAAIRKGGSWVARTIDVVTPDTTPPPPEVVTIPTAPSGLTATAVSGTQVSLAWTDNSNNETGFKVQRATDSGFTVDLITTALGMNVTSYSDTGLIAGTTYYYRTLATNTAGDSTPSQTTTVTTQPLPPPTPENQPPVMSAIGNKSVSTGMLLTFTVSASDPDADALTYSASNLPSGAAFNATTRVFSWTPGATQAGSYPNVHFQVSDGSLIDSEDITITVAAAVQPVSFSATIQPMFDQACNICHPRGGVSLSTYAEISARATDLGMGSGYLTTAQKETLATWVSQGLPNN